ncbi:MAG: metallophosphoesterase [Candidatus Woesearchaeota archaeon]
MVRIFAAGDFHGDRQTAAYLAQKAVAEKADIIILNGDIVEEDNTEGIMCHFVKTGKPVFLVPGNHDWLATDFLAAQYNVTNLHGKSMQSGNVGILGCGGANVGLNMLFENEIYETILQTDKQVNAAKKLLVTHVHPANSKMEKFSQFVKGSTGLRKAIEATKPDVVICGHVHEAEGIEEKIGNTLVINVGKKGRLIEL